MAASCINSKRGSIVIFSQALFLLPYEYIILRFCIRYNARALTEKYQNAILLYYSMASIRKGEVSAKMNTNESCNMLIREICSIWSKCSASFQKMYGISQAQLLYLQMIEEAGSDRVYLKDLEKSLNVGQASVVRMIDRLESLGLIEKLQDEKDSRKKYTRLTCKGLSLYREAKKVWKETEAQFGFGLTAADLTQLHSLLTRVCQNSQEALLGLE